MQEDLLFRRRQKTAKVAVVVCNREELGILIVLLPPMSCKSYPHLIRNESLSGLKCCILHHFEHLRAEEKCIAMNE